MTKTSKKATGTPAVATPVPTRNPETDIFVILSYNTLRTNEEGKSYDWLHAVWSGFNSAFRQLYPDIDPVQYMQVLGEQQAVDIHPFKGGARFRLRAEMLRALKPEEKEVAQRLRTFLTDFKTRHDAERIARTKQNGSAVQPKTCAAKMTRAEKMAQSLWQKGDTAAALKKLGY